MIEKETTQDLTVKGVPLHVAGIRHFECDAYLVLDELVNYTKFHFTNEEKFLEKINYPQFEEHQKKHLAIIEDLMNLIMGLMNNGSNDEFKTKLLSFFQRLDYLPHYD